MIKALPDGLLDTTSTSLTLLGRNVTNFGEAVNENFVKLLENFASPLQPEFALLGQIWYDTSSSKLKVYDGINFRAAAGPVISTSQPSNLVAGDFWINSDTNQLRFYDGTDLVLVGPVHSRVQGETGFRVETVIDTNKNVHTICYLFAGNVLLGLFNGDDRYELQYPIVGFSGSVYSSTIIYNKGNRVRENNLTFEAITDLPTAGISPTNAEYWRRVFIEKGFTSASSSIKFDVVTTKAESIITATGTQKLASQILYNDEDAVITGALTVQDNRGITLGIAEDLSIYMDTAGDTIFENTISNKDVYIKVKRGNDTVDAVTINTLNGYVGIFNDNPLAALDVVGSASISGNLVVTGTVTAASSDIATASSSIILGSVALPATPSDGSANGGGIILKATADKSIRWIESTNRWTSNVGFECVGLVYSGALTGSSQQLNIGAGQIFKSTDGKVGLGTETPTANLQVVGDVKIGNSWTSTLQTPVTNTDATLIYAFNVLDYRSADVFVQVVDTTTQHSHCAKFTLVQSNLGAFSTKYGEVITNSSLGTFSVNVQADEFNNEFFILFFTASSSSAKVVDVVGTAVPT